MASVRLNKITAGKLNLEFFNKIIERIESTKPLPGDFVEITDEYDGKRIALDGFELKELDVCEDGEPSTIKVLAKKD